MEFSEGRGREKCLWSCAPFRHKGRGASVRKGAGRHVDVVVGELRRQRGTHTLHALRTGIGGDTGAGLLGWCWGWVGLDAEVPLCTRSTVHRLIWAESADYATLQRATERVAQWSRPRGAAAHGIGTQRLRTVCANINSATRALSLSRLKVAATISSRHALVSARVYFDRCTQMSGR